MRESFSKAPVASHSKVKIALSLLAFFTVKETAPLRARFEGGRILRRQNSEASHPAIMDESDINSVLFLFLQAMNFIVPTTVLALADEVIE